MAVSEDQIRIAWAAIKREVQPVYDELPDSYRQFLRKRADNAVAFGPSGDAVFDAFERIVLGEAPETPVVEMPPEPAPEPVVEPEPAAPPEPEVAPESPEPEKPAKKPVKRAPKKAAEKAPAPRKIVVVKKAAAKKATKKAVKK